MKLGIIGLPNVGKSTLFNALTGAGAPSANYPFCTIDPNVGVIAAADVTLDVEGTCVRVGVFGFYRTLILRFPSKIEGDVRVLAQDFLLDKSIDMTTEVSINDCEMRLDGKILRWVGKRSRIYFDNANPALLLEITITPPGEKPL